MHNRTSTTLENPSNTKTLTIANYTLTIKTQPLGFALATILALALVFIIPITAGWIFATLGVHFDPPVQNPGLIYYLGNGLYPAGTTTAILAVVYGITSQIQLTHNS